MTEDDGLNTYQQIIVNFNDDLHSLSPDEVKVSNHLRGPQRLQGESYQDYRLRRKGEDKITKMYLGGFYINEK